MNSRKSKRLEKTTQQDVCLDENKLTKKSRGIIIYTKQTFSLRETLSDKSSEGSGRNFSQRIAPQLGD
jgi:hypothetical protein